MRKQINKAVEKHYSLGKFFIYTTLVAFLMLGSLIIVEVSDRFFSECEPSRTKLTGNINPGLSKAYEINYQGGTNCYLIILPSESTGAEISLWFYQPNGEIQVMNGSELLEDGALVLKNVPQGKYRISIHNKNIGAVDYNLTLYLASN